MQSNYYHVVFRLPDNRTIDFVTTAKNASEAIKKANKYKCGLFKDLEIVEIELDNGVRGCAGKIIIDDYLKVYSA